MSFQLQSVGGTPACRRGKCVRSAPAEVITAQGEIGNETADDFVAFLRSNVGDHDIRPVVMINSPGGTVVGAMKLGLVFRKIGAAVIVARSVEDAEEHAHVLPGACMSACVYAFFGGTKRVVPSVSRLGIHRMAVYEHERDPAGGEVTTRSFGSNDIVTALSDYTKLMGVNPAVIEYAEQISPESIHIVTPGEIARWRLGSSHL